MNRAIVVAAVGIAASATQYASDIRHLTLREAVNLALSQNRSLRIARLRVVENEQQKAGERSAYFPIISNQSNLFHITDVEHIGIPAGSLGSVAGAQVPVNNVVIPQGFNTVYSTDTMMSQPVTQL